MNAVQALCLRINQNLALKAAGLEPTDTDIQQTRELTALVFPGQLKVAMSAVLLRAFDRVPHQRRA